MYNCTYICLLSKGKERKARDKLPREMMMRSKVIKKEISRCEVKGEIITFSSHRFLSIHPSRLHNPEMLLSIAIHIIHPHQTNIAIIIIVIIIMLTSSASHVHRCGTHPPPWQENSPAPHSGAASFFFVFLSHFHIFICVFAYLCNPGARNE